MTEFLADPPFWFRVLTSMVLSIAIALPFTVTVTRFLNKRTVREIGRLYVPFPVGTRVTVETEEGEEFTDKHGLQGTAVVIATMFMTGYNYASGACAIAYDCGCILSVPATRLRLAPDEAPKEEAKA